MDTIVMFRFAKLYNLFYHPVVVAIRFLVLFLVLLMLWFAYQQGATVQLPLGLILLFLMIQLFFTMKFKVLRPAKTVQEAEGNPSEAMTLLSCSLMLQLSNKKTFVDTLLRKKEIRFVLSHMGVTNEDISIEKVDRDELVQESYKLAKEEEKPFVTVLDLFAAYLLLTEKKTKLLFSKELKRNDLLTIIAWGQSVFPQELVVTLPKVIPWGAGIGETWVSGWTLETKKYTQDFTSETFADSSISAGREKEFTLLVEALLKNKGANALLIGEPGVGKKNLVSSFVMQSFLGDLPANLRFLRVLELLSGFLVAGTASSGQLEERLRNILDEVKHAGDVILFVPEIQNIAGAGSDGLDVTGVLLPHLLDGSIRVIATATPQNYKMFLEKRTEFTQAFEIITLEEPANQEATPMLLDASLVLEKKHSVVFTYQAVMAAAQLSSKYMQEKSLPGKAVSLLDELGARTKLSQKKTVTKEDISMVLQEKIPVKIDKPQKEEKDLLLHLESVLHKRIIDQEEAVKTVSEAMRRLRSGLAMEGRPVGVFLFLGPTGVGKTETAKALAQTYFGSEDAMIRFDMSEYQEVRGADRLIDKLTSQVRNYPFSLILLDEFEKAYLSIRDIFLSVFEDGRLTDTMGRTISFENTIIIATSNAGSEKLREGLGQGSNLAKIKPVLMDQLQKEGIFKPELLNRFDAIVLFEPLGEKEIEAVTELLLQKLAAIFEKKDITFRFDKKAISVIAKEGFDQTMGARPLRRFIQDHVEDLLSQKMLRDEIERGDIVILSTDTAGNLTLDVKSSS